MEILLFQNKVPSILSSDTHTTFILRASLMRYFNCIFFHPMLYYRLFQPIIANCQRQSCLVFLIHIPSPTIFIGRKKAKQKSSQNFCVLSGQGGECAGIAGLRASVAAPQHKHPEFTPASCVLTPHTCVNLWAVCSR